MVTGSEPWVLVAGGFHQHGGMDKANSALAAFLASRGRGANPTWANLIATCGGTRRTVTTPLGGPPKKPRRIPPAPNRGPPTVPGAEDPAARRWLGTDAARPIAVFVGALGLDTNK